MTHKRKQYFLDRDDSGHWYLIPAACREKWEQFCGNPDPYGNTPDYLEEVGGHPSHIVFEAPTFMSEE